ncbi:hypothetical protein [Streptomyces sp. NPDC008141]|uniref:hypothetical protein n=1 Tax=Streptomyces sp. NPDC008141 TaxID=3364815 RepID=UPI0036E43F08
MLDALVVSQQVAPYITAAVVSYGTAVLSRSAELSADASISLGQRLLGRILRRDMPEQSPEELAVTSAVEDLAENPEDSDLQAALRVQIKKLLLAEPDLIPDIVGLTDQHGVSIVASGDRSVAAHTINGGVHTGDKSG